MRRDYKLGLRGGAQPAAGAAGNVVWRGEAYWIGEADI